jgi:hypothetical protein
VKPNLAFGPIDTVTQYLLYLSIVVLGVLLPLLVQRWRTRREKAALRERTERALVAEHAANRRRLLESQRSLRALAEVLARYFEHRQALRLHRLAPDTAAPPPEAPADADWDVLIPLLTRTAWDVARLADALVLLPEPVLTACSRVHHLQELHTQDRSALMQVLMQLEHLRLPADLAHAQTLDRQLEILTVAQATVRYQIGLADGLLAAYDAALPPGTARPPETPTP